MTPDYVVFLAVLMCIGVMLIFLGDILEKRK